MSRPCNKESLMSLADQLVWAIQEYIEAGIDDMKGVGWDADSDTLHEIGRSITHNTAIFPEATNLTITIAGHANADTWSAWVEIQDSAATTFTSKIIGEGHITAVNVEDTSISGKVWMLEIAYGVAKINVARIRFISASLGGLPAITGSIIRSDHIPDDETVYARLMCSAGGEDCMIHIRYYLHVH